jgi:hypothetical protein
MGTIGIISFRMSRTTYHVVTIWVILAPPPLGSHLPTKRGGADPRAVEKLSLEGSVAAGLRREVR